MKKTIADVLKEEGGLKAQRKTLLRLLRAKFGEPPAEVATTVEGCADTTQLDAWTDGILKARRLSDLGIVPPG